MWKYHNNQGLYEPIKSIEQMPDQTIGFIYLITNLTNGKKYIGKKSIYSERTKPLGKKELANLTDKRKSKKKTIVTESNWKEYNGSCKPLLEDIAQGHQIDKTILVFCKNKISLTYNEVKYQFKFDVLESEDWYNDNILNRFFRPKPNKYEDN